MKSLTFTVYQIISAILIVPVKNSEVQPNNHVDQSFTFFSLFPNCFLHFTGEIKKDLHLKYVIGQTVIIDRIEYSKINQLTIRSHSVPLKLSGGCYVHLIQLKDQLKVSQAFLIQILEQISLSRENPDYIFLLFDSFNEKQISLVQKLHKVSLSSKYFAIDVKSSIPYLLNQLGSKRKAVQYFVPIDFSKIKTREELSKLWLQVHKNFHRALVCCNAFEADFVLEDFMPLLNYTRPSNKWNTYGAVAQIWRGHMASEQLQSQFLERKNPKWLWIAHGVYYSYFSFVIFANRSEYDFTVLIKPFDMFVWIFVASSIILVALSISLWTSLRNHSRTTFISSLPNSLLWTGGVLLELSEENISKDLQKKPNFFICIWLLVAIVISNGYRGCIFSFMSRINYPQVPQDLEALANSDIKLVTIFHDLGNILSDIKIYQPSVGKRIGRISDRLYQLGGINFWYTIPSNFNEALLLQVINLTEPQPFAIIERGETFGQTWIGIMSLFTNYFVIRNNDLTMTQLFLRHPWNGVRNFFLSIFIPLIRSYHESGIVDYKERQVELYTKELYFKKLSENSHSNVNRNYFSFFTLCDGKAKDSIPRPKPIAVEKLYMVLLTCSAMIIISIISCLFEFCWMQKNHVSRLRRP